MTTLLPHDYLTLPHYHVTTLPYRVRTTEQVVQTRLDRRQPRDVRGIVTNEQLHGVQAERYPNER